MRSWCILVRMVGRLRVDSNAEGSHSTVFIGVTAFPLDPTTPKAWRRICCHSDSSAASCPEKPKIQKILEQVKQANVAFLDSTTSLLPASKAH